MNQWIHTLLQELEEDIRYVNPDKALEICRVANSRLSAYMKHFEFHSKNQEILYFKIFKPRFMAHQLQQEILFSRNIEGTSESAIVTEWMRQYYASGETKADGLFFTLRHCPRCDFDLPVRAELPEYYAETADKQVARLLAEEWLFKNKQNKQYAPAIF